MGGGGLGSAASAGGFGFGELRRRGGAGFSSGRFLPSGQQGAPSLCQKRLAPLGLGAEWEGRREKKLGEGLGRGWKACNREH